MTDVTIRELAGADGEWVKRIFVEHWGADFVVVHGAAFRADNLPGFIAEQDGERTGLITHHLAEGECEIVSLNSLREGRGTGTALLDAVETAARDAGCTRLWLVTTNDNLDALRFYQKRGFVLVAVHPNAVDAARRIKPIPATGCHGIPIRDEIELEKSLGEGGD